MINFFEKFPEYKGRTFFIAGESYAGKYIPDLAVLIDTYNYIGDGSKINLKSIIIGNGVMDHRTINFNTYGYMIDRRLVDPEIVPIFQGSCQTDRQSAGCHFFEIEFRKGTEELNPYSKWSSMQMSMATATTTIPLMLPPGLRGRDIFLRRASCRASRNSLPRTKSSMGSSTTRNSMELLAPSSMVFTTTLTSTSKPTRLRFQVCTGMALAQKISNIKSILRVRCTRIDTCSDLPILIGKSQSSSTQEPGTQWCPTPIP